MDEPHWWITKDGDKTCLAMYNRHYSAYQYRDGRVRRLFCGPGEKVVLRTDTGDALFVWRKFIDACIDACIDVRTGIRQDGINCAIFRNESKHQSSDLVRQADQVADAVWPDSRHYTYVNPASVRGNLPGACFLYAGWRYRVVERGVDWIHVTPFEYLDDAKQVFMDEIEMKSTSTSVTQRAADHYT